MKLPNFLVIGVQKAGTTSIYSYLKKHPQVYMSPVKETNFLERNWDDLEPDIKKAKPKGIYTFERYCELFEGVTDEIAIGEASPNYLLHYQDSSKLIERYLPDVKMLAIIRDPSERAYSDYLMHIRDAINVTSVDTLKKRRTLSEQIEQSPHTSYMLLKGRYYQPIKHFIDKFGRDRVQIYLYDDLCESPQQFMQSIYRFIGVDESFTPDISLKFQVAAVPKNQWVNYLLKKNNIVKSSVSSLLKTFFPTETRENIKSFLTQLNSQPKKAVAQSQEERQHLVNYYREDILKLQDLIDRDLSSWLKV